MTRNEFVKAFVRTGEPLAKALSFAESAEKSPASFDAETPEQAYEYILDPATKPAHVCPGCGEKIARKAGKLCGACLHDGPEKPHCISAAKLAEIGQALFGPSWQTPLADALGVAVRTVQRWAAGEREPAEGVWRDLATLCRARAKALERAAEKLA